MITVLGRPLLWFSLPGVESSPVSTKLGFLNLPDSNGTSLGLCVVNLRLRLRILPQIKAMEGWKMVCVNENVDSVGDFSENGSDLDEKLTNGRAGTSGKNLSPLSTIGNSTNILWHECSVEKLERQKLLGQKGCVIWVTGLSGSGKSSVACALSRSLHHRGKLSYILDGDNVRHGLNRDLSFKAEDRVENIRRVGEVAKLFADAGVICIASLIFLPTEGIGMPAVHCYQVEILLRCSWMYHSKFVKQGTQRVYISLHVQERLKVLLVLMIRMSHH